MGRLDVKEYRYHYIKGLTNKEKKVIHDFLFKHTERSQYFDEANLNNDVFSALYYALGGNYILTEDEPSGDSYYYKEFEESIKLLSNQLFDNIGYIKIIAGWKNSEDSKDDCEFTYFEGE